MTIVDLFSGVPSSQCFSSAAPPVTGLTAESKGEESQGQRSAAHGKTNGCLSARVVGGALLLIYGLVVFGDEGLSELINGGVTFKGNAVVVSPLILGSTWGFQPRPTFASSYSGNAALIGFAVSLLGVFLIRYRLRPYDYDDSQYIRAGLETLICASAWILVWVCLLWAFQPSVLNIHVTQTLTGISNEDSGVIAGMSLALFAALRLRVTR